MIKFCTKAPLLLMLTAVLTCCTSMRTEFYREETRHLYETGCTLYSQGAYEQARSNFEKIINLDPDYGAAHAALGNLAMIREEYQQASNHYQEAVKHDPELKSKLLPFLIISDMYRVREPLVQLGIDLGTIYPLIMDERFDEVDAIFEQNIPIELLAKDTVSLTPGKIGEMRQKAAEIAHLDVGTTSFQLFLAYLLFYSGAYDDQINSLLSRLVEDADGKDLQRSYVLLGRLNERMGNKNEAVNSFLAAVDAGLPLEDVAHYLARIYQVDLSAVLPSEKDSVIIAPEQKSGPFSAGSAVSEVSTRRAPPSPEAQFIPGPTR